MNSYVSGLVSVHTETPGTYVTLSTPGPVTVRDYVGLERVGAPVGRYVQQHDVLPNALATSAGGVPTVGFHAIQMLLRE